MPNTFPTISQGSVAMHPSTINRENLTRVVVFRNGAEQRWPVRVKLARFELNYPHINGYDLSILLKFFSDMKGLYVDGSMSNVFSLTIDSVQYDYCVFDQDEMAWTEDRPGIFSTTLRIRQLRKN